MKNGKHTEALIALFIRFPGIGQRQAERFTRFIARSSPHYIAQLTAGMQEVQQNNRQCPECFIVHESETATCEFCLRENTTLLVVVEKDADVYALGATADLLPAARFFVFGGLLPIANRGGCVSPNSVKRSSDECRRSFSLHSHYTPMPNTPSVTSPPPLNDSSLPSPSQRLDEDSLVVQSLSMQTTTPSVQH